MPGEGIVWRSVSRQLREVHAVLTFTLVADEPDLITVFIKPGWPTMRRTGIRGGGPRGRMLTKPDGGHELREWKANEALCLYRPGDPYSVWLYWGATDHDFRSWYINLEEPWERTPIGFDSRDNLLDIVIAPDLSSWEWKDEDASRHSIVRGPTGRLIPARRRRCFHLRGRNTCTERHDYDRAGSPSPIAVDAGDARSNAARNDP